MQHGANHPLFAVPLELRQLKQWVVWKYEDVGATKPTKVPYQINGRKASSIDAANWNTFEECFNVLSLGSYNGLGFVFTNTDYSGIDLDYTENQEDLQRQIKIFNEFDSYSEKSPSGKGCHIIVKGKIPSGKNNRKASIELYPSGRFFTMTGNIINNSPITDKNDLLNQLYVQMGGEKSSTDSNIDNPSTITDEEIINLGLAHNTDIFEPLHKGIWKGNPKYPSQSEADQAYVNFLAAYTDNRKQCERIFKNSELGKTLDRKSNQKYYISKTIKTAFDQKLPPIDFKGMNEIYEQIEANKLNGYATADSPNGKATDFDSVINGSIPLSAAKSAPHSQAAHNSGEGDLQVTVGLGGADTINESEVMPTGQTTSPTDARPLPNQMVGANNGPVAQRLEPTPHKSSDAGSNPAGTTIPLPPGLLGEIAQFIYDAAPKPVREIALAGAIGLMAGICGKAYNVSDMGLNQYILVIAGTGKGKEAMASGISKLINACKLQVPVAPEFIGPSAIASKQGLHKYLVKNSPCFVSILGEFGLVLKAMSTNSASSHQLELQAALLDIYHKSGFTDSYGGSAYSDQDKNSIAINAPAFSILGESTPENFYSVLDEQMINSGLLPRFTIIEYNGPRVPSNENKLTNPSIDLISKLSSLMVQAKTVVHTSKVINIQFTPEALALSKNIDKYSDDKINNTDKQFVHHLWNRAHIKALKLAAIVSVGIDIINPIITVEALNWAMSLVDNDIKSLSIKFEAGEIGANTDELKQVIEATRIVKEYAEKDFDYVKKYGAIEFQHKNKVVNNTYLSLRLAKLAIFRNDRIGGTSALKRTIQTLIDCGNIIELKGSQLDKYKTTGKLYFISPTVLGS